MKRALAILSICFCAAVSYCQTPQEIRDLAKSNNAFAAKFYASLAKDNPGRNIFFSPYSISTAFSILYAGASSDTARQIAETFSFSTDTEKLASSFSELQKNLNTYNQQQVALFSVANAVWIRDDFKLNPQYSDLIKKSYETELSTSDFKEPEAVRTKINEWVSEKTAKNISELFAKGDLNGTPELVLANAVYFKGRWRNAFNKNSTRAGKFSVSSSTLVNVRMMHQKKNFSYSEKDNVQVIELPYSNGELSMLVILPKDAGGLATLEQGLTIEKINRFSQNLWDKEVSLNFPKFKISYRINLKDSLKKEGVLDAFGPKADFSLMAEGKSLFITNALHKAFAEVDEEGTEAAASTAVQMSLTAKREIIPEFNADRPFLFIIRENQYGSILFMGRITDPSSGNLKS